ncbi:MAG: U32 family peptidase, partial [Defluviitaleaceae bacterium]|nr:U32 family peptidase [Defluviitaleaceae bacterium]
MKNIELLAPAGDFEKLQMAIAYGANAVYLGGSNYSLRANSKNFDTEELEQAIAYAHNKGVKIYVAVNIFAHNTDLEGLPEYLQTLKNIGADAVIVADPGIFNIATQVKGLEVHISTQANVTNYQSALFYHQLGAKRIVLARELTFKEIIKFSQGPYDIEAFVHGAMCMSYSGRCLLSNFMTDRDANQGNCSQPCRWKYAIAEEKNPGEYMPIFEDERGTYIMNSKDLCMIEHIPQLIDSGVTSFKIEGRMKSAYYVALVTRAYREAIDDYLKDPELYIRKKSYYVEELKKTSHREFFTGFYFGTPSNGQNTEKNGYNSEKEFIGLIKNYDHETGIALVEQRNKFSLGEEIEIIRSSGEKSFNQKVEVLLNMDNTPVESAPHAQEMLYLKVNEPVNIFD